MVLTSAQVVRGNRFNRSKRCTQRHIDARAVGQPSRLVRFIAAGVSDAELPGYVGVPAEDVFEASSAKRSKWLAWRSL